MKFIIPPSMADAFRRDDGTLPDNVEAWDGRTLSSHPPNLEIEMELLVVMAQRKGRYEGEYAPEALAVITEYGNDENPDYLAEVVSENRDSGDFTAVEIVRLVVDDGALNAVLFPSRQAIQAVIKP